MRIDSESRRISIGVRELVGQQVGRWDVPFLPGRAELGRELHSQRRQSLGEADSTYRGEIPISQPFRHRGFEIQVQGRIDGLYERGENTIVEEFKSVAIESHAMRGLSEHDLPAPRLQLGIYLYMLALQGVCDLLGELVVVSIFEPEIEWSLPLQPFDDEVEAFVHGRFDEIIDAHLAREEWLEERRRVSEGMPFPHGEARPIQLEMMGEIEEALGNGGQLLIEAPTGVGKTAAAFFSMLRMAYSNRQRIFYVTAKTSGQQSAMKVVAALKGKEFPVTAVQLTARDKLCPQPVVYCHPDFCPYADRYHEKLAQSRVLERLREFGIADRGEIARQAEQAQVCPFELSLDLTTSVDVVICDFNYVFSPNAALRRIFFEDKYDDWLVIVDEAHNLVPRSREYYSPALSWSSTRLLENWGRDRGGFFGERVVRLSLEIQEYFWECMNELSLMEVESGRDFFQPDLAKLVKWRQSLGLLLFDDPLRRRWGPVPGEQDTILSYYREVSAFVDVAQRLDDTFSSFLEREGEEVCLRILCHDASGALKERVDGFGGVVAMSATLSPAEFYRDTLGLDGSSAFASYPSPFPREKRGVFVVGDVPDRYRDRVPAIPQIARVVRSVLEAKEGNYALYLPSFEFLHQLRPELESSDVELLVQDARMDDLMRRALLRRLEASPEPRGLFRGYSSRLLVAVQGGSFAEGIEWPEGVLSGVIIVGPGLPRMAFEQEMLKNYYEERGSSGFEYAYLYPGMARVIQAAGRLIRREEDRGVIVLVGERFGESRYARLLPRDWYERDVSELIVESLEEELRDFWALQIDLN